MESESADIYLEILRHSSIKTGMNDDCVTEGVSWMSGRKLSKITSKTAGSTTSLLSGNKEGGQGSADDGGVGGVGGGEGGLSRTEGEGGGGGGGA